MKKIYVMLTGFVLLLFSFIQTKAQVSVTATAGTTGPTSYVTVNDAFAAINAGTHQGDVIISVTANTSEPVTPIPLLRSTSPSSYTSVLIRPVGGDWTINSAATPTASRGVIELSGADNVTIDGDPALSGSRHLSIVVAPTANTGTAAIRLSSNSTTGTDGADNNTVKNCIITGGRNSETSVVVNYGINMSNFSTTSMTTGAYSSINTTISNNLITRCFYGVYANGSSVTYPNTGMVISNNTLGSSTSANNIGRAGIYVSYTAAAASATGAVVVEGNDIRGGDYGTAGYSAIVAGVEINAGNYGAIVRKNNIHDISQPTTNGWMAAGIYISSATNNTLGFIYNNFVRDMVASNYTTTHTSLYYNYGIYTSQAITNYSIDYNTIVLKTANTTGTTVNPASTCVYINNASATLTSFRNNIIVNTNASTNALGIYTAATGVISGAAFDNNNWYVPTGKIGYYNAAFRTTLSDWQTATSKDASAKNVNPVFASATDLHIPAGTVSALESAGATVAGINTDYDGNTRPGPAGSTFGGGTAPDIGADEFDGALPTNFMDWVNLQWPPTLSVAAGQSVTAYTQGYEAGVTEAAGPGAGILVWIGINNADTDPATWPNSAWIPATFNVQAGNNDEFMVTTNANLAPGTYYYASRWQITDGPYRYGGYNAGGGGYWQAGVNVSGVLTVTPPANDNCSGAIALTPSATTTCAAQTSGNTLAASQSSETAPSCGATGVNDDVWYSFVATSTSHIVTISNVSNSTDMAMALYSGSCGSLTEMICSDPNTMNVAGLTVGQTYYVRVWTFTATASTTATFDICITTPPPMTYVSSTTTQSSTSTVSGGSTNQQIIRVEVVVNGVTAPMSLTQLDLNTNGSTSPATDITAARVYYTGTSTTFATTTQFGSTVSSPNGAYSVTGSQVLTGGLTNTTNYFWIVYDIACGATATNVVDGEATSITVAATPRTPTVTAPTGTRAIIASTSGTYSTVANGPWSSAATWSCGNIPTSTTPVNINHNVTVNSAGAASGNLTIASTASLTIVAGGDLTIGNSAGGAAKNNSFTNNGQFTISGGSLKVNGNILANTGSVFNQSGGEIVVDGNNGGLTASSVASATPIVSIQSNALNSVNLTGGIFTIVDPHAATGGTETVMINGSVIGPLNVTNAHTFKFGDGVSTDAGGNSGFGFRCNWWFNETGMPIGNIVVEGPTGTNRFVSSTFQLAVLKDITVKNGGELRTGNVYIGGNLIAEAGGTITTIGTTTIPQVLFANVTYSSTTSGNFLITDAVNPQTIGGAGIFRNAATSPTASIRNLSVQNASAGGVTLSAPLTLNGTLAFTKGILNTTSVNLLTVGISGTTPGSITRTDGMVNGPLKKWFAAATGSATLPIGTATLYKPATINFTTAPTAAGTLTASFSSTAPNFPNAVPLMEGSLVINRASTQGSWFVEAGDGLTGGAYTGTFTGNGATDILDYTKTVLIKRPSAGGDWTLDGTHVTTTGSNTAPVVSRTGMANFSEFAIGGELLVALPVSIEYFTGAKQGDRNRLDWKINCYNSATVNMSLERSADGRRYESIYSTIETSARCQSPFTQNDLNPLPGINYYRLKTIDIDGKVSYSNVVALLNKDKGFEMVSLAPNPVVNKAVLNITSAERSTMEIVITDVNGKQVSKQRANLAAGNNQVELNLKTIAAGTYQVSGFTPDGEKKTLRFVKQ